MSYGFKSYRIKPAVVCKRLKESIVFCDHMPCSCETPWKVLIRTKRMTYLAFERSASKASFLNFNLNQQFSTKHCSYVHKSNLDQHLFQSLWRRKSIKYISHIEGKGFTSRFQTLRRVDIIVDNHLISEGY